MKERIPTAVIKLVSEIFSEKYNNNNIDLMFKNSGAPLDIPIGMSKRDKVNNWLMKINNECENPLDIFGKVLESFFDEQMNPAQDQLIELLKSKRLEYKHGGQIINKSDSFNNSLRKSVYKLELQEVDSEIDRALNNVATDPLSAIHNAANILEATFKAYLDRMNIAYKEDQDTLSNLWSLVVKSIGINPGELDDKDLKMIASGLFKVVDGTMHVRNKKSAAHGKSENQAKKIFIKPRHARLAIRSAHTLAVYICEFFHEVKAKD